METQEIKIKKQYFNILKHIVYLDSALLELIIRMTKNDDFSFSWTVRRNSFFVAHRNLSKTNILMKIN